MMTEVSSKTETVYDKLNKLNAEIAEGIINLGDSPRDVVQRELTVVRDQAYKERSPEAVFATILFRRYAAIANDIKDSKTSGGGAKSTLIGDLPSFMYEKDDDNMLVGWEATKTNIFRMRAIATLFALLTFSVMSAVPNITEADFKPEDHFDNSCPYKGAFKGSFNFRPYELVVAVGVLAFVHNLAQMWYYWLPVDANRQKYVPGGTDALAAVVGQRERAEEHSNTLGTFCRSHSKFLEVTFDGILLVIGVIAFMVSQYVLDSGIRTTVEAGAVSSPQYYTLSTCYATYSSTSPPCLDKGMDPTSYIRGGLAMLFFCNLFLSLNFLVSLRSFRQDPNAKFIPLPTMPSFARGEEGGAQEEGSEGRGYTEGVSPLASQQAGTVRMVVSAEEAQAARADYGPGSRV